MIHRETRPELWSYMAGICRNQKILPIAINGFDDHAHLLFHLPASMALATAVSIIKSNSCTWRRERERRFDWQDGYGAFSIGQSDVPSLKKYIAGQKEHHRKRSFQEELIQILKEYDIEYDERYLWN